MKQHLNTLFVMTQGAYLKKDGETIVVRVEKRIGSTPHDQRRLNRVHGPHLLRPQLLGACAQNGIAVSFMTIHGRFWPPSTASHRQCLLRREQYRRADDPAANRRDCSSLLFIGKLANFRTVLRRAVRDQTESEARPAGRKQRFASKCDYEPSG